MTDIHGRERRLENALRNIKESEKILPENKRVILSFLEYLEAEGLSVGRRESFARRLKIIGELFPKPFIEASKRDIVELVRRIEGRGVSQGTMQVYKVAIRKLFKWLRCTENYPPEVSWIKVGRRSKRRLPPEELLTERDVERLLEAASDTQMKAMLAVLWETGCRVGELLTMRIGSVIPRERYAQVRLSGKTGERCIPIVFSWPYLQQWMMIHPYRGESSSPMWLDRDGKPMKYGAFRMRLQRLAKKAGVTKPVNPHSFRHARASQLAKKLTESQLSAYFGWVQGSEMPQVYVHLSGRDLDPAILTLYGLEEEVKREPRLKPVICPRCGATNEKNALICHRCGAFLSLEMAIKAEEERRREIAELRKGMEELKELVISLIRKGYRPETVADLVDFHGKARMKAHGRIMDLKVEAPQGIRG